MATTSPATNTSGHKFNKRLLPPALASVTPHGPINKLARSAGEQAALDKRKNEILQSMNKEQIDAAYSGEAVKINEHLQRKAKKHAEIDSALAQLKAEHEMEMRVIRASLNQKGEQTDADDANDDGEGKHADGGNAGTGEKADEVMTEGHEDGEVEMTG